MATRSSRDQTFVYPKQPIHPDLVRRLYAEADRLAMREARTNHLELADDLGPRLVAATLRRLDRTGHCLSPRNEDALSALLRRALATLRLRWRGDIKRDYGRAAHKAKTRKAAPLSLEVLEGDSRQPSRGLYGADSSWQHADSLFPGDDLLAGETGRGLLELLQTEYGLSRERALTVLLSCILPNFPAVEQALAALGCEGFSPSYLRKWAGKEVDRLRPRLQQSLRHWGIGRAAETPEVPSGTSGVSRFGRVHTNRASRQAFPGRREPATSMAETGRCRELRGEHEVTDPEAALDLYCGAGGADHDRRFRKRATAGAPLTRKRCSRDPRNTHHH